MSFVAAMSSPDNTKVGATKVGVNGADVYTEDGVGNLHVSLFTMLNRGLSGSYIEENVGKIFEACKSYDTTTAENAIKDLFVMAFQTRDVRGGKGERKLFNSFIVALYKHRPDIVKKLVTLVPEYGCWRDMWDLYNVADNELKRCILDVAKSVFFADVVKCSSGDVTSLSLIAKWLPREKSGTYPGLARTISNHFYSDIQSARKRIINYRLDISTVNKALKTVEINMCGKQWATIKPDAVPGRCLKIHNKAFLNEPLSRQPWKNNGLLRFPKSEDRIECREHFLQFIDGLKNGTRKAHGANVVMPHELVENSLYTSSTIEEQEIIQGQWNSIREETVKLGGFGKCVPMCDFSGSMDGTPKLVSLALGILISEINHNSFKDHILTFDSDPKWHSFSGMITLKDKLNSIRGDIGVGLNTNFYKACMRILQKMKDNKVPVGEEPEDLIVLTDMGWDAASSTSNDAYYYSPKKNTQWATQVEQIRDAFVSAGEEIWGAGNGWKAPRIVIWNLRGDFKDFHAKAQDNGVVMLSGWSPSILKALQKGGVQMMTPLEGLRQVLDDERYDKVRDALKEFFP